MKEEKKKEKETRPAECGPEEGRKNMEYFAVSQQAQQTEGGWIWTGTWQSDDIGIQSMSIDYGQGLGKAQTYFIETDLFDVCCVFLCFSYLLNYHLIPFTFH